MTAPKFAKRGNSQRRVEVGDAIDAKHHGLAIDHELPVPVLARCLDNPRVAVRPVVATARNQAHAFAVPLQPEAVAVVFDLMQPVRGRPGHWLIWWEGKSRRCAWSGLKIGPSGGIFYAANGR